MTPKPGSERARRVCVRLIMRSGIEVGHRFEPVRVGPDPGYRTVIAGPSAALLRIVTVCPKHYDRINKKTRQRPGENRPDPLYKLEFMPGHSSKGKSLYGLYSRGVIRLAYEIGFVDDELSVYVVTHEFLHWLIEREVGSAACTQLDVLHEKPLRIWNGNSMRTFMLNRFRESRPTPS